jgi:hypothetical protein
VYLRGKVTERSASLNSASGFGPPSRRNVFRVSVANRGKPRPAAKADCSRGDVCAEPIVDRSRRSVRHEISGDCGRVGSWPKPPSSSARGHMTTRTRTTSQEASPDPGQKLGNRCFPVVSISAEAEISATEPPSWMVAAEAAIARQGTLERWSSNRPAEACRFADRLRESCLPPTHRRSGLPAQDTQCWDPTTTPLRFGSFRRLQPGRSLCRFASPTPSALRVSHPLSGLIPPRPCGFVSRHIRP